MHASHEDDERLHRAVREIAEPVQALAELWARGASASSGLSAFQLRALQVVGAGGRINLTGLAESAGMALSSASRLCDRLEAAGLLERAASAGSRREIDLMLTGRGRRLLSDVETRRRDDLSAALRAMPPDQVAALVAGLRSLHDVGMPHVPKSED